MKDKKQPAEPVFIISLPRSGSTMLQRIISSHSAVDTFAEPWLLLPLIYGLLKDKGIRTIYGQKASKKFVGQILASDGCDKLYLKIKNAASALYPDFKSKYFVDKTPRYYLIAPEIKKIFPDSKVILLYRNPVHVFCSIVETSHFCNGRFRNLDRYLVDLKLGIRSIAQAKNIPGSLVVNYENLVANTKAEIKRVCDYLDIEFEEEMLTNWKDRTFEGKAGDKDGVKKYNKVSESSLTLWKSSLKNRFRKFILQHYVKQIPDEHFNSLGYCKKSILRELKEVSPGPNLGLVDFSDYCFSVLKFHLRMMFLGYE